MIIDVLKNEFHCMTFEGADVQEVLEVVSTTLELIVGILCPFKIWPNGWIKAGSGWVKY